MAKEERRYISYLLRLWQISSEGELVWRASLESPKTGERRGFTTVTELFTFLDEEMSGKAQDETRSPTIETGN